MQIANERFAEIGVFGPLHQAKNLQKEIDTSSQPIDVDTSSPFWKESPAHRSAQDILPDVSRPGSSPSQARPHSITATGSRRSSPQLDEAAAAHCSPRPAKPSSSSSKCSQLSAAPSPSPAELSPTKPRAASPVFQGN